MFSRWWFQFFLYFHPENWGRFPFWLIFFKWVGSTTNEFCNAPKMTTFLGKVSTLTICFWWPMSGWVFWWPMSGWFPYVLTVVVYIPWEDGPPNFPKPPPQRKKFLHTLLVKDLGNPPGNDLATLLVVSDWQLKVEKTAKSRYLHWRHYTKGGHSLKIFCKHLWLL